MLLYTILIVLILVYGLFEKEKQLIEGSAKTNIGVRNTINIANFFLFVIFTFIFVLIAFRGKFSADYINYETHFQSASSLTWNEILSNGLRVGGTGGVEFGFYILMKIISIFTTDPIWLFVIVALLTIIPIYLGIRDESENRWLSLLLFVVFGSFITSFNVIRSILAYSCLFFYRKLLYDKKYFHYIIIILITSFIHTSSVVMLIVILLDLLKINNKSYIFLIMPLSIFTYIFSDKLILIADRFLYDNFFAEIYQHGIREMSYGNIIAPLLLGIIIIIGSLLIDSDDRKYKVGLIATFLWIFFRITMINFSLMRRFADMMSLFMILFFPYIINRLPFEKKINSSIKIILAIASIVLFYYTMRDSPYNPYYFIWDK